MVVQRADGLALFDDAAKPITNVPGNFLKTAIAPFVDSRAAKQMAAAAIQKQAPSKEPAENGLALQIFQIDGALIASHFLPHGFDAPLPQFCFDARGAHLLLARPETAMLTFFSPQGEILHHTQLFQNAPFSLERPLFLAASRDGFVALTQFEASTPDSMRAPMLFYFSNDGKEKWRRELSPGTSGGAVVSGDGRRIAVCRYDVRDDVVESETTIFGEAGQFLAGAPVMFRHAHFTTTGKNLALATHDELLFMDSANGHLMMQMRLTAENEHIAAMSMDEQDNVILLAGRSEFASGDFELVDARLFGVDSKGMEIFRQDLAETLRGTPVLVVNAQRREILLAADGFLHRFRIDERRDDK
jgi:hypothetical protein